MQTAPEGSSLRRIFLSYWMTAPCPLSSCYWVLLYFDWNERAEDDFPVASQRKRPKLDG